MYTYTDCGIDVLYIHRCVCVCTARREDTKSRITDLFHVLLTLITQKELRQQPATEFQKRAPQWIKPKTRQ